MDKITPDKFDLIGGRLPSGSVYHYVFAEESMTEESPFACDMTTIAPDQRGAHIKLFGLVRSISELSDGYAFELSNESQVWLTALGFIVNERLCCRFFDFALQIEREGSG